MTKTSHRGCRRTALRRIERIKYLLYVLRTTECEQAGVVKHVPLIGTIERLADLLRRAVKERR